MMTPDFDALVSEYQAEGIGQTLYSFISDIVAGVTRHYPAPYYSPNEIWDEDALSGLCHDFIVEKLLRAGLLDHYLLSLQTVAQFRQVLQRDFRHFLINRRRKDEFSNLVRRVHRILITNDQFATTSSGLWGLQGWSTDEEIQRLDAVVQAMYKVDLPPISRYKAASRKIDHLISTPDLERLLADTFKELGRFIDFQLLIHAIRYRLNLHDIQEASLDEPGDTQDGDIPSLSDIIPANYEIPAVELTDIVLRIYSQLSAREQRTLSVYLSLEAPTLEDVSARLDISKSTVGNHLSRFTKFVTDAELTEQEIHKLFEQLSELFVEVDQQRG